MFYKWDVYQVYRAKKDYDSYGTIIKEGTLLQIIAYNGSSITLKTEDDERHFLIAKELLNEEYFKRVF